MKKILLLFMLVFAVQFADAQTYAYRAYAFSVRVYEYGRWSDWSDWEDCNVMITIAFDKDRIVIYSQETQVYQVVNYKGNYNDARGGSTSEFDCLDANHLRCNIRLRKDTNDTIQLYVDYNDASWVYNIVYVY